MYSIPIPYRLLLLSQKYHEKCNLVINCLCTVVVVGGGGGVVVVIIVVPVGGGADVGSGPITRQQVRCCLHQQQPDHPPQHPHQRVLHHRQSAR